MTAALQELAEFLTEKRADDVVSTDINAVGELSVTVIAANLVDFIDFLKTERTCRFSTLIDITAVDYPSRDRRFDVVYHFLSMYQNHRIRVKVAIREEDTLASISSVHPGAGWYEREIYDMFGILFTGHADLRRLLTDYGFRGHPLRKDFPTTGYTEVRYDEELKRVVYEPVSLVQEYRQFDFMSPWEGAHYVLPGDEKAEDEKSGEKA
ncbi:NADH-quinone oxidoreductase subunit C [Gymnodinialimonas ceratoperidinii]|uniref:NADH-quinone oxidoreductase subunit C n=1 Tax=Gymnodinialimonas ceratoperidinii TaxID=2856823 RepID=A0A8F6YCG5_9RHOB|nr:NADH-quinone oxidoreductase subunit C [Gymnodinialimonas ceratoperidinii]QXT39187.1 NADH-quinone oxidoreductase subunit C [Gymnodinialimonas ceratoperidinii]